MWSDTHLNSTHIFEGMDRSFTGKYFENRLDDGKFVFTYIKTTWAK